MFTVHDLSGVVWPNSGRDGATAPQSAGSLDLSEGPLLRCTTTSWERRKRRRGGCCLWSIIWRGHRCPGECCWKTCSVAMSSWSRGLWRCNCRPKRPAYQQWAEVLQGYAQSPHLLAQIDYWTNPERDGIGRLPVEGSGTHLVAAARVVTVRLAADETQWLLTEVPKATRAQVHEVLLTALGSSLSEWSGEKRVLIDVESHGREETVGPVDLTRTVGWFTVLYPLLVEVGEGSWSEKLRRVKEQQRQAPEGV